jgi:hypothetical protein
MRNKLEDLNNHLFEALERLNDDELTGEELEKEIKRAKTVSSVAHAIIANGNLVLQAQKHADEYGYDVGLMPLQIADKTTKK